MKREIYYTLSPRLRRAARRIYYFPVDFFDSVTGKRDKLTPPKGRIFIGSGDFRRQGEHILQQMTESGGLKPDDRVLDVGCGIGRIAVPLTRFLSSKGSYEGFDIVKSGINWCKKHISTDYPNFNFKHIDLKNELYNLTTEYRARDFVFPYRDEEFDFAFLISVFTHMMPEDVEGYLRQLNRVLKKDGTCFCTFFVMNKESKRLMNTIDGIRFDADYGNYYLHNTNVKEANVAFDEDFLMGLFNNTGFELSSIHYGYWSGRKKETAKDFQDVIILKKKRAFREKVSP